MNLDQSVASALGFSAGFGLRTATILFVVCAVGEFAVPIPLMPETMWLLASYYLGAGNLSAVQLTGLWMIAQLGRQAGSISLYYVAGRGADRLTSLDRKLRLSRFVPRSIVKSKAARHITDVSPFSAAFARLVGLRLPLVSHSNQETMEVPVSWRAFIKCNVGRHLHIARGYRGDHQGSQPPSNARHYHGRARAGILLSNAPCSHRGEAFEVPPQANCQRR